MKITTKQYAYILDEALQKQSSGDHKAVIKDFVSLLASHGKISKINEIIVHWNKVWNKRNESIDVIVETADGSDVAIPSHIAGKKVLKSIKTNPAIIGGTVIKIGDYIVDNSIASKINALKK